MGTGLILLAADELMELHERIGRRLDGVDLLGLASGGSVRGWNDVIVILYGVVALPFGVAFFPSLLRYPKLLELLCIAFGFFVIHTAVDSLVDPRTAKDSTRTRLDARVLGEPTRHDLFIQQCVENPRRRSLEAERLSIVHDSSSASDSSMTFNACRRAAQKARYLPSQASARDIGCGLSE